MRLSWCNLSVHGGRQNTLLTESSGHVRTGEMVAIIGPPSGHSHSVLLHVLAGRRPHSKGKTMLSGSIRLDDQLITDFKKFSRQITGLVESDPAMYRNLTIREMVESAAVLSNRPDHGSALSAMGLADAQDELVGDDIHRSATRGEQRRTAIAAELVRSPRFLFLDNPAAGLDAFTAYYLIESVRENVARQRGVGVVVAMAARTAAEGTQSNMLGLFDRIVVLGWQGETLFDGAGEEVVEHIGEGWNLDEAVHGIYDDEERIKRVTAGWKDRRKEESSGDAADGGPDRQHPKPASWLAQFGTHLKRDLKNQFRDRPALIGLIAQMIIISLLLAFIFFQLSDDFVGVQNRIGLLFFLPINYAFTMAIPLLSVISQDKSIVRQERYSLAGYHPSAALLAEFIALLPLRLFLALVSSFIIYYISGLRTDSFSRFLVFFCIVSCLTIASVALGIAIGAAVPSVEIGQIVGPLLIVVFIIFGGNLANADTVTWILRWIQYVSIIFYGFEGLVQNELDGLRVTEEGRQVRGEEYLSRYSLDLVPWYFDVLALVGLAAVFLVVGWGAIKHSTRPNFISI